MDKKQRKANQKLQQAQNFAENLRANQNLPLEEKALRTKVISPEIGKHLKFAILKENIYFDSYWALPTKRRNLPSLSGNIAPFMRKGTLVSYEISSMMNMFLRTVTTTLSSGNVGRLKP